MIHLPKGGVSDRAVILIDHKEVAIVDVVDRDATLTFIAQQFASTSSEHTLDIIVENMGRTHWGQELNYQKKGLNGDVFADDKQLKGFDIFSLDFNSTFMQRLKNDIDWNKFTSYISDSPAIFRATLQINDTPKDTFLKLYKWTKGVVFINGFNIGRYWNIGPTKTLYIPAPYLLKGINEIHLFELHSSGMSLEFVDKPELG